MNIDSDINILGGLPDWGLIGVFLDEGTHKLQSKGGIHSFTAIKTDKSVKRFKKAIQATFLQFKNSELKALFTALYNSKGLTSDTLLFLFWNASGNNELLHYINEKVYFNAFYSGRVSIRNDEVTACIKELKQTEADLKKWSESTITTTASKYLTLMKKFGLMQGTVHKTIIHPFLSDEMFVLYLYWLVAVTEGPNLLQSDWLRYGFNEQQVFLDRVMQKKYAKYFHVVFTGNRLSIEPIVSYESLYDKINQP